MDNYRNRVDLLRRSRDQKRRVAATWMIWLAIMEVFDDDDTGRRIIALHPEMLDDPDVRAEINDYVRAVR
ncbi:MAG: hypothetical protein NWE79_02460 [Candidatus Bathyarchaeota archaeon]|nr:hypothetical protein [Candidatus Bathyarchaeota archaeon]